MEFNDLTNDLMKLTDAGSQCEYLMMLGFQKPPVERIRTEQYRIGGCNTAIWIKAGQTDERVDVICDSDSLLVRGVLVIFEALYDGKTPWEITAQPPDFLACLSDEVIYPEIKQNGLLKCYQRLASFNK